MLKVKYQAKRLDEVCEIVRGKRAVAIEGGAIPVFGAGERPTKYTDKANAGAGSIRVTAKATLGNAYLHSEDFWAEDACIIIRPKEGITLLYLYHWLKKNQPILQTLKQGDTIPRIDLERFKALSIEVPSLDYQEEVCHFLYRMGLGIVELIKQGNLEEKRLKETGENLFSKFGGEDDV